MLENMDETQFSLLLLPLPYDTYTRDLASVLQTVFTIEGDIPSQCSFDKDVLNAYLTGKYEWIENICGNRNKILILVFLTTKSHGAREDNLIYELLQHCLKQRIVPLCKVVFLHLTDDDTKVDTIYHGQHIHLKQDNAYDRFLCAILSECGKDVEGNQENSEKFQNMRKCDASKHFLKLVSNDDEKM